MSDTTPVRRYFESAHWKPSAGRTYLLVERQRLMQRAARRLGMPSDQLAVCDVGCGLGDDLAAWGAAGVPEQHLAGTDLLPDRIASARARVPQADIRLVDGYTLPFDDERFDVCTASLVFSTTTSHEARRQLLFEMARVTRTGGLVAVYDFVVSKPWNRRVRRVSRRELTELWRPPTETLEAAPFLPVLDLALNAPKRIRDLATAALPKTHRIWIWTKAETDAEGHLPGDTP